LKNYKLSLIIPTLDAEKLICPLIDSIKDQTVIPDEIIIVDSESEDNTVDLLSKYPDVKLIQIKRSDFDHGKTRDMALRSSIGEYVVFMTQDAVPNNKYFIEKLLSPFFKDDGVALSTGRQLPKPDASRMEQLVRTFNYPSQSRVRSKDDIPEMGIKTYFASDVCSAYRRDIYERLGGFDYPIKTNEDMFYAAKVINAGYKIAYCADAEVLHSHNFTLKEQYKRNYIQGYEIERHRDILGSASQESEGMKLVKYVSKELLKKGRVFSFIHFGFDCCARLLGSKKGRKDYLRGMDHVSNK